jgi:hypothetical protein
VRVASLGLTCDVCDACQQRLSRSGHPPAAPVVVLALILLQDVAALESCTLVCSALNDGVAVVCSALRLALVPWQLVQVILEELVASRPVLIALQPGGKAESFVCSVRKIPSPSKFKHNKGLADHLQSAARQQVLHSCAASLTTQSRRVTTQSSRISTV